MKNFSYELPVHIEFGWDRINHTGELIAFMGNRALVVVSKGGSAMRSGVLKRIETSLQEQNISYEIFSEVLPNPGFREVQKGAAAAKAMQAQFVIAVGGGSVIDCAKGIADCCYTDNMRNRE